MRSSALRRTLATGASLAVAAVGLAGVTSPAHAESGAVATDCTINFGLGDVPRTGFTAKADTDLPARVTLGTKVKPSFNATITVPADTADLARQNLGTSVSGTAAIASTVSGAATPASATLPATSTGAVGSGPLVLDAAGSFDAEYAADVAGAKAVSFSGYTATLQFTGGARPTTLNVVCKTAAGADSTVDKFTVVDPNAPAVQETTTAASTTYKKRQRKLVAKVEVANADGTAASGDVQMLLKQGKKKSKVTVTLNKRGKAKNAFTKVAPGTYKLVAKYKGSDVSEKSREKLTVKVK